jgi:hypothetical protein
MRLSPQHRKILNHINRAGHITAREAIVEYSITSLHSRLAELTKLGYRFKTERREHPVTGQPYNRYSIRGVPGDNDPVLAQERLLRAAGIPT